MKERQDNTEQDVAFRNQSRIPFNKLTKEEEQKRFTEAKKRESKKKYGDGKNFYTFDSKTNGFTHNEPVQITVIRYDNGKAVKGKYNRYFMPEGKFTEQAKRINGQSKKTLALKGAKKFSKADADDLVKFLNVCR